MLNDLFPFPLRAFEQLFVHDDSPPDYPAVFSARFEFDGPLSPESAQLALEDVLERQPMLRCHLRERANGTLQWVIRNSKDDPLSRIKKIANRLQPICLRSELPFRISLEPRGSKTIVTFQFHHAIVDGVGALQVINDWMRLYDRRVLGSEATGNVKLGRLDAKMLRDRCRAALTWHERLRLAPWCWLSMIGLVNFFKNRPIPLVPLDQVGGEVPSCSDEPILSAALTEGETENVKARAMVAGATVNDLIAVELFAAMKQWQAENDVSSEGSHFRITIPINERSIRHRRMPACNHCTMISLDCRPSRISLDPQSDQFESVLQAVHHDINMVREWRLSLFFWTNLKLFNRIGGIKRWFTTRQCHSTCVLTNLGQLGQRLRLTKRDNGQLQVAGIPLTHVELAAPIRYGTAAAFSIFIYQRRLNITMNYDSKSLSPEVASALLERLKQRLSVS